MLQAISLPPTVRVSLQESEWVDTSRTAPAGTPRDVELLLAPENEAEAPEIEAESEARGRACASEAATASHTVPAAIQGLRALPMADIDDLSDIDNLSSMGSSRGIESVGGGVNAADLAELSALEDEILGEGSDADVRAGGEAEPGSAAGAWSGSMPTRPHAVAEATESRACSPAGPAGGRVELVHPGAASRGASGIDTTIDRTGTCDDDSGSGKAHEESSAWAASYGSRSARGGQALGEGRKQGDSSVDGGRGSSSTESVDWDHRASQQDAAAAASSSRQGLPQQPQQRQQEASVPVGGGSRGAGWRDARASAGSLRSTTSAVLEDLLAQHLQKRVSVETGSFPIRQNHTDGQTDSDRAPGAPGDANASLEGAGQGSERHSGVPNSTVWMRPQARPYAPNLAEERSLEDLIRESIRMDLDGAVSKKQISRCMEESRCALTRNACPRMHDTKRT